MSLTWQHVVVILASLVFVSFVLVLFASNPDWTEFRSAATITAGLAVKEFWKDTIWPAVRAMLKPSTALLSKSE